MKYVRRAEALGVDTSDPQQMHFLVKGVRYSEARFAQDRYSRPKMAEQLNTTEEGVDLHRVNPLLPVAMKIVFEVYMEELRDSDLKQATLRLFKDDYLDWLKNMSRIAKGQRHPETKKVPLDRDAINAFSALSTTKLNEAFLEMLFVPEAGNTPEQAYLASMKSLESTPDVVDLDTRPARLSPGNAAPKPESGEQDASG